MKLALFVKSGERKIDQFGIRSTFAETDISADGIFIYLNISSTPLHALHFGHSGPLLPN